MCKPIWTLPLKNLLNNLPQGGRVAVLGVGNELRGDDAAGVQVARRLASLTVPNGERLLVLEGGAAPEAFTGSLRRFNPHLVLLVDVAGLGAAPGSVEVLSWDETTGLSASTHTMPPSLLGAYLTQSLGCQLALIGIQPVNLGLDEPISPEVAHSVEQVALQLAEML